MEPPSKTRRDMHLLRKISHFLSAPILIAIIFVNQLTYEQARWFLTIFFLLGLGVEIGRYLFPPINQLTFLIAGKIMRGYESNGITSASFYALGMAISFWIFPFPIAVCSSLCLAVADPLASLIGLRFGKRKIVEGKSVEGTLACFFSSVLCIGMCFKFIQFPQGLFEHTLSPLQLIVTSLLGGAFSSMGELCSSKLDDNLTIPLMAGTGISIAFAFFF